MNVRGIPMLPRMDSQWCINPTEPEYLAEGEQPQYYGEALGYEDSVFNTVMWVITYAQLDDGTWLGEVSRLDDLDGPLCEVSSSLANMSEYQINDLSPDERLVLLNEYEAGNLDYAAEMREGVGQDEAPRSSSVLFRGELPVSTDVEARRYLEHIARQCIV